MLGSSRLCLRAMSVITHPLVVVLGATGAGKSKLSLDIGKHLGGEIVSVDSMQIYEGLDIVTNKVTKEEREICPHHLIGIISPLLEFTITDFQKMTLKTIQEIHERGKLPILVGGTNYYVESILWDYLVNSSAKEESETDLVARRLDAYRKELSSLSTAKLHNKLKEVDPKAAAVTHPNNRRKIIRALEVFHDTGKAISGHWEEQVSKGGSGVWGGPVRFSNACILWVQCEPEVLKQRINLRVHKMIEQGLIEELQDFHKTYNAGRFESGKDANYEHGIFQSIGFKEFHKYLTASENTPDEVKEKMFAKGVFNMQLHTWQYAKYQIRMIRARILNRKNALPVYNLDATDPQKWDSEVLHPSLRLLKSIYKDEYGIAKSLQPLNLDECNVLQTIETMPVKARNLSHNYCVDCEKHIPDCLWQGHVRSKRHKSKAYKRKRAMCGTSKILQAHGDKLIKNDATSRSDASNDNDALEDTFFSTGAL